MSKLIIIDGPGLGSSYELQEESLTLGRDGANAIQLQDSQISRCHAQVKKEEGRYIIRDLDSKNGILVNDNQVREQKLVSGDCIKIGSITLRYIQDADTEDKGLMDSGEMEKPTISATVHGDRLDLLQKNREISPVDLERTNLNLIALYELSRITAEARNVDGLMKGLVEKLRVVMGTERVFPIIYDNRENTFRPWKDEEGRFKKQISSVGISQSIVRHVIKNQNSVLSTRTTSDERFNNSQSIASQGISTAMCVPLKTSESLIGVIYVDRVGLVGDFTREELEFLTAAANQLAPAIANLEQMEEVQREKNHLEKELKAEYDIIGDSVELKKIFSFIEKAAPTDAAVLILGASGTGKELVARAIHYHSPRSSGPLEIVNCAAMTEQLVESELFGHMKGSFTGAHEDKPGRFELADGGTIFLDEIGELPESSQAKILRVLEQGDLRRVGGRVDTRVNVRVLAATNRNIAREVKEGKFREDLYYRLNVLRVDIPRLKDRPGDIKILTDYFLDKFCRKCAKELKTLSPEVDRLFEAYPWPGNVRELRNTIERMVILGPGKELTVEDVPFEIQNTGSGKTSGPMPAIEICSLGDMERRHIVRVLQHTNGNKSETANILGIDRSTLYSKIKAYNIET